MQRSDELRDVILGFWNALAGGDVAFLERHISTADEVRGIGTDPDEWWSGTRLLEIWKQQIEAMGGSMPVVAGDPEAYVEGSIGWVADQPKLQTPDGDLPLRFTAVFRQEDGDWKIVQSHGSIGVANEESFGEDIPT
jgi:ketosteroid isomerase-like protein